MLIRNLINQMERYHVMLNQFVIDIRFSKREWQKGSITYSAKYTIYRFGVVSIMIGHTEKDI